MSDGKELVEWARLRNKKKLEKKNYPKGKPKMGGGKAYIESMKKRNRDKIKKGYEDE